VRGVRTVRRPGVAGWRFDGLKICRRRIKRLGRSRNKGGRGGSGAGFETCKQWVTRGTIVAERAPDIRELIAALARLVRRFLGRERRKQSATLLFS